MTQTGDAQAGGLMTRTFKSISILVLLVGAACSKPAEEKAANPYSLENVDAPENVKKLIQDDLLKWINDPVIVDAIVKANLKNQKRTQEEIKTQDDAWIKEKGITDFMREFLTNDAAAFLKKKQKESDGRFSEIFIMDFQGCNVAMSTRTSDFWQGDEAKFTKSYNEGRGAIFVDKVKYDESTKVPQVQVSLPVMDPGGKVVGAITIGVSLDNLP